MNIEVFTELGTIEAQIRELEAKKEALRIQALEEMKQVGADKVEADFGTFTLVKTKRYEYSEEIDKLNEALKTAKKAEEEQGIAKEKVSESLRFTPTK